MPRRRDSSSHKILYSSMSVQQQSRPYFASGGTPQLTTFTYDALGRAEEREGESPTRFT
jgi:hypothetical protein